MRNSRPRMVGVVLALVLAGVVLGAAVLPLLDAEAVLRTGPVGALPWRVVVDEQSGRAFIANNGDLTMSVLDTTTGQLLSTVPLTDSPHIVAVDPRRGRVFVTLHTINMLGVLDATSGRLLRTVPVGTSPEWPAVDEPSGHVFVANSSDPTVTMLDAQTGRVLRTVSMGTHTDTVAVDAATAHVFVTGLDGTVAMLDARSGRLLHSAHVGQTTGYFLAVAAREHRVFVSYLPARTVSMLDARTGRLLWAIRLPFSPTAALVDEHTGRAFVAGALNNLSGRPGWVAVLDARTGAPLRSVRVDDAPGWGMALDTRRDHVLLAAAGPVDSSGAFAGYGYLDVLDGWSGRLLRRVPVEGDPQAVGVDERAGRAFVANTNVDFLGDSQPIPTPRNAQAAWIDQVARRLKRQLPWLPITLPAPRRAGLGSVTVLDLARL